MKTIGTSADAERFQAGAEKYAAYLKTPEGRLRLDLTFANLEDFLPPSPGSLRALDIGCGTGAMAVRLARLGLHVTLLDSSPEMLGVAERAAQEAGIIERIALKQADATDLANSFDAESFDLILCHNILEYIDGPTALLRSAAGMLRHPSGIISVLVRNQAGEVLKAAIKDGNMDDAENSLTAEWGNESLYGGKVRLFTAESLQSMMAEALLVVRAQRGVRVLSDYLPSDISRDEEYDRIFELERKLGRRAEFTAVARYTQCIARCANPALRDTV